MKLELRRNFFFPSFLPGLPALVMRSGPRGEGKSGLLWERSDIRALRDSWQWRRKSNTYLCFEKDAVLRGSPC